MQSHQWFVRHCVSRKLKKLCKLPARTDLCLRAHLPKVFIQLCELLIALYFALMSVRDSEEAEVEKDGRKLVSWGL